MREDIPDYISLLNMDLTAMTNASTEHHLSSAIYSSQPSQAASMSMAAGTKAVPEVRAAIGGSMTNDQGFSIREQTGALSSGRVSSSQGLVDMTPEQQQSSQKKAAGLDMSFSETSTLDAALGLAISSPSRSAFTSTIDVYGLNTFPNDSTANQSQQQLSSDLDFWLTANFEDDDGFNRDVGLAASKMDTQFDMAGLIGNTASSQTASAVTSHALSASASASVPLSLSHSNISLLSFQQQQENLQQQQRLWQMHQDHQINLAQQQQASSLAIKPALLQQYIASLIASSIKNQPSTSLQIQTEAENNLFFQQLLASAAPTAPFSTSATSDLASFSSSLSSTTSAVPPFQASSAPLHVPSQSRPSFPSLLGDVLVDSINPVQPTTQTLEASMTHPRSATPPAVDSEVTPGFALVFKGKVGPPKILQSLKILTNVDEILLPLLDFEPKRRLESKL
ncbi:hypothetical protein BASA83_010492 [Batrachochytrium salamandrivorans]|nr:hypothetical protein BASA83_010492 [Batrachochytrium salamandrivorans]